MAKSRSGGGITSNKNVRPPIKGGSPKTNVVSPGVVSRIGAHEVLTKKPEPLTRPAQAAVPLGNAVATNVGAGGPGTGRTVHPSGSQSATPKAQPISSSTPNWPWGER
jgi:hypothetical protein